MQTPTRRQILNAALGGSATIASAGLLSSRGSANPMVVIGAGPAGISAALGLRRTHPKRQVVLLERDPTRLRQTAAAGSVFAKPGPVTDFGKLNAAGIDVVIDDTMSIDWHAQCLDLLSGRRLGFDTVVLAPGVAPRSEGISGYDAHAQHAWPAAWGSAREAQRLAGQLMALPEHGHVVLRLPADADGYAEIAAQRAIAIARLLERNQKKARLVILDGSGSSAARARFDAIQTGLGAVNVDWRGPRAGGTVLAVDATRGFLETSAGRLHADVVNFVVPQTAAPIARLAGLTDASGWCPVSDTRRSTLNPQAIVIGDVCRNADRSVFSAIETGRKAALSV